MAFIRVADRRTQRALGRIAASLCVVVGRGGHKSHGLRLIIGKAVAQEKGWAGQQTRIRVAWGSGDDFGWLKIERTAAGGRKLTEQRHHLVTDFRTLPTGAINAANGSAWRLIDQGQRTVDCRYRDLPDGSLAIQLPSAWFEMVRPARSAFKAA